MLSELRSVATSQPPEHPTQETSTRTQRAVGRVAAAFVFVVGALLSLGVIGNLGLLPKSAAVGGSVGLGLVVLSSLRPGESHEDFLKRLTIRGLALIIVCALIAMAVAQFFIKPGQDDEKRQAAIEKAVSGFPFWAGQPELVEASVKALADANDGSSYRALAKLRRFKGRRNVSNAIEMGASDGSGRVRIWGVACSHTGLGVPKSPLRKLDYRWRVRLVSGGGRNELWALVPGPAGLLARGTKLEASGIVVATGASDGNVRRSTLLLAADSVPQRTTDKANVHCNDTDDSP